MKKLSWYSFEFKHQNNQLTIARKYTLANAIVSLELDLDVPDGNNIVDLQTTDQSLLVTFDDHTHKTFPLSDLILLLPSRLTAERLIASPINAGLSVEPKIGMSLTEVDWNKLNTSVNSANHVLAKKNALSIPIAVNEKKGPVQALLTLPSELNSHDIWLLILYQNGCIETRTTFHHDQYSKLFSIKEKSNAKKRFKEAQDKWPTMLSKIDDAEVKVIISNIYQYIIILNARLKNNAELTELLEWLLKVIDDKYNKAKETDFDEIMSDSPLAPKNLMTYTKDFKRSSYIHGIVWTTLAMIAGLALTGLAAFFFTGVLISGLGAIIVGLITLSTAAAIVLTDMLYIKDTYYIGRLRHELKNLFIAWDDTQTLDSDNRALLGSQLERAAVL